ncbi:MAG: hypothetical protein ABSH11_14885, partial [Verrucomicrobiota bacterium]
MKRNMYTHPRLMLLVLAFAVAASFNAAGAVTLDGTVSTVKSTNTIGNSITVTNTTGTGENRLMLVGVSWNANTVARTISSVTFTPNGGTAVNLTEVRTRQVATNMYRYAAIYSLTNPPSGQTGVVIVTFSISVTNGIVVGVANFKGVDQTTPLGTSNGASATNTAPSVTLTNLNGDELVFDTVFIGGNPPPTLTVGANQTQQWTNSIFNTGGAASTKQATNASVTMSWTAGSSGPWATVAVPIKPAVADTTPPTVTINQAAGQADPTSDSPINFTVVFSESVSDFATGDVTLSGTATNSATTAIVTGSGTTYNVAVSGMTNSGTVIASIAAGVAHDAANNSNEASTSTDNTVTYEYVEPSITYVGDVGSVSSNTVGTTLPIPVGAGGVAAGNTIVVGFASRGASTYNAPVVTDSKTNTYSLATNAITYGHGRSYIYFAHVKNALVN